MADFLFYDFGFPHKNWGHVVNAPATGYTTGLLKICSSEEPPEQKYGVLPRDQLHNFANALHDSLIQRLSAGSAKSAFPLLSPLIGTRIGRIWRIGADRIHTKKKNLNDREAFSCAQD